MELFGSDNEVSLTGCCSSQACRQKQQISFLSQQQPQLQATVPTNVIHINSLETLLEQRTES